MLVLLAISHSSLDNDAQSSLHTNDGRCMSIQSRPQSVTSSVTTLTDITTASVPTSRDASQTHERGKITVIWNYSGDCEDFIPNFAFYATVLRDIKYG